MPEWLPSLLVGAILQFLAVGLAFREWIAWRSGPAHLPDDDPNREFARRQFIRRLRVSLLLALCGILIPAGDLLPLFYQQSSTLIFALHWMSVMGVVVLIVLIALGDLAASMARFQSDRQVLKAERASLEAEIRNYRNERRGANGTAESTTGSDFE